MPRSSQSYRCVATAAALAALTAPALAQFTIPWSTLDAGGARVSAGAYRLQGTLAQPDSTVPRAAPNGFTLTGGFWAATPPSCPGDLNADGVINTNDLVPFLASFGLNVPLGSPADLTGDGTVSTSDLVAFLTRFGTVCP